MKQIKNSQKVWKALHVFPEPPVKHLPAVAVKDADK